MEQLFENSILESRNYGYSTYVKCDCGGEILEFNGSRGWSPIYDEEKKVYVDYEDNINYYLRYHGPLKRKDIKYGFTDFYFKDKLQVFVFIDKLRNPPAEGFTFLDDHLPEKIIKKYGQGGIKVGLDYDGFYVTIAKYTNLNKKHLNDYDCSWEILLTRSVASKLADKIEAILLKSQEIK